MLAGMKAVLQRVSECGVVVEGRSVAVSAPGRPSLLVLAGLEETDTETDITWMAEKIPHIRIFPDAEGKMNLSVLDTGGTIVLVPNFTLAGDAVKGRRPSFDRAMRPERSEKMFAAFLGCVRAIAPDVQAGIFRAQMRVQLVNDGPVTILLDSRAAAKAPP